MTGYVSKVFYQTLSKNKRLTTLEKGPILANCFNRMPVSRITGDRNRSRFISASFLCNETQYSRKNPGGRPPKLSVADKRRTPREASGGNVSSFGTVKSLERNVSSRLVLRVFLEAPFLRYKRTVRTPAMKLRHEKARAQWALERCSWTCFHKDFCRATSPGKSFASAVKMF